MTAEERDRIISQDYADLIIEYNGDRAILEEFPDSTVNIINSLYAVVHVPVAVITETIIVERGYSVMPLTYGIISEASLEASGIIRLRNIPNFNLRGAGVLLGMIDTGIDYTNPVFRNADGTTRIAAIWDQTIVSDNFPPRYQYGTEYTQEQINEALQSENPFETVPSTDENGHGTMVAGITGGNESPEDNFYGIASDAEFAVVKLKPAKQYLRDFFFIREDAVCFQSNDILFGIQYLFDLSASLQRPLVICISLGSSQGGHDGKSLLANYISLSALTPGIAIVAAAGNEGNTRRHYFGIVDRTTGYNTVELNIGENEQGFSMELWGQAPSIFSVDLLTPSGEFVPRIAAGRDENRVITFVFEETIIYLDYQIVEGQSGDQLILFRFQKPSPGIWRFNVYDRGDLQQGFHIWLPMEGFITDNTYFIRSDPYTTILSVGNSDNLITITGYNYEDDSLFLNASRGYTRVGVIKPEIAAPGVNVIGPTLDHGFASFTGTSIAAAQAAGITAMLMEWGYVNNNLPGMNSIVIKKLFIRGARRDIDMIYPNRDWGYGILDIYNVFDSLRTVIG